MPLQSLHVRIAGRVQGGGFRAWTQDEAQALGLSGWVANMPDGTVEAVFSGEEEAVRRILERCASGPRFAVVEEVRILGEAPKETGAFRVARSPR
ncbi:acylphosphatase [Afifella pfennigii]|uniref:acylphosphatase n=1 Tax=Afifella pfennigii TaxID=209897 RepID=UPI000479BB7D|nr:acylphosphatase [Afifella pfennigii]